jgi:hypothetical protein
MPGPYRFALTFQDESQARLAALVPGATPLAGSPTAVEVRTNDFEEGYRLTLRMIQVSGLAAREAAVQAAVDGVPEGAAVRERVGEIMRNRFLGQPLPAPPPSQAPPGKVRYFGAR